MSLDGLIAPFFFAVCAALGAILAMDALGLIRGR